ncbi:DUF3368 domain-containing protein [Paracnuella aquatica]|uniref:DUF3368 domain-containing protein n=1 Tax=Paracnuella aquatica TaxID=2268757 RepID=UPI000DEF6C00|nr:DUF3368 domain-containing protein [Paracnuella aquatica]RPD50599.1 DUF3368 domain-containing protein [Paracnuella aquatica]
MPATIISDTSCFILLDKIQELDLLHLLFGQVVTTPKVLEEFGAPLPEWVIIQAPTDPKNQQVLTMIVDAGEASAIALAMEHDDCLLIIDEIKGRNLAKQLGLKITGTLGLLIQAKTKGHIESVLPLLHKIKQTNFRISASLETAMLRSAGE